MPKNILVNDLSKGIPFETNSIDVIYHSHLFENIDRKNVKNFLNELKRVLKPDGIQKIVVPYFYFLCSKYLKNLKLCEDSPYIKIEQCVMKESSVISKQNKIEKKLKNFLLEITEKSRNSSMDLL